MHVVSPAGCILHPPRHAWPLPSHLSRHSTHTHTCTCDPHIRARADPGRALLLSQAHTCALAAARACTTLLNHLLISDPMRTMYWNHRQRDLDALLAATGLQGDAAQPAGPPGAPHA